MHVLYIRTWALGRFHNNTVTMPGVELRTCSNTAEDLVGKLRRIGIVQQRTNTLGHAVFKRITFHPESSAGLPGGSHNQSSQGCQDGEYASFSPRGG
jgi:hypothetical protein